MLSCRTIWLVGASLVGILPTLVHGQAPPVAKDPAGDPLPPGALVRLGTIRWRTGPAYSTALSSDGKRLFVGGSGTIRAFDIETGAQVRSYRGPEYEVRSLALAPDGKSLVAAAYKGAFLLDVESGQQLRPLKLGAVAVMTFSHDGKKLITGGEDHDHAVRVIDIATGKEDLRLLWHRRQVSFVACSADNKTLVTASGVDNDIRIADLTTGDALHTFQEKNAHDTVVALSPDFKTLAVADMRYQNRQPRWFHTLRLIDVATGKQRYLVERGEARMTGVLFTPDGKSLVVSGDKECHVYDVAAGTAKRSLPGVHGRYFSPDGRHLIGVRSIIRVWDFESGKELHPPEGPLESADSLAFGPDGAMAATCGDREVIHLWDSHTGRLKGSLKGHTGNVRGVQFAPDGRLVSGGGDSTLRVWDVAAGKETFQFKLHDERAGEKPLQVTTFHVSRDGEMLAATAVGIDGGPGKENSQLFAWNLKSGKLLAMREQSGYAFDWPGFSPDGKWVVQHDGKDLVVNELLTGKNHVKLEPAPQPGGEGVLNTNILESPFSFSADGRLMAARGNRQRNEGPRSWRDRYAIVVFDLQSGKEVHRIAVDDWASGAVFSPDSRRLAGVDGPVVRIWEAATGKRLWESAPLDFHVRALAFSPDGVRLATALDNATTLIWNVGSPK